MTCPGEVIVVHFILGLGCQKVQQFLLLSFFPYKSNIFGAFALATGVDLAEGMLAEARSAAQAAGLYRCTDYQLGDFVELADEVPDADITILDKVVCCYPEWQTLLDRSLEKTRRVYALTYPRNRSATRAGVRAMHWILSLVRCCYQPYIHDPEQIEKRILEHGFYMTHAVCTAAWHTQVYCRR